MKTVTAVVTLTFLVSLLVAGCGPPGRAPTPTVPTLPVTTVPAESSPSYDTLAKGGFVDPSIPRISAEDLKLRLDKGESIMLIDSRSDWKFKMGHLPGATNITDAIDSPFPGAEEAMDKQLAALPNDTLKVLYCD